MSRRGSINVIVLIFFLISLLLGTLSGIYQKLNSTEQTLRTLKKKKKKEKEEVIAVPIHQTPEPQVSLPGRAEPEEIIRKSYVIKGVGKKGFVAVDLPEENSISMDSPDEKSKITIKLPPQLEEIASEAQEHIDAFDEATRKTVQAVIESLNIKGATPDKATIRPSGEVIQLNVSIPVGKD